MRRILSYIVLLTWAVLAWGCGDSHSPSGSDDSSGGDSQVTRDSLFTDRALEAAVRAALGRPEGPITQEALSSLRNLDARDRGIKDLRGIGWLDSLQSLELAENEVTDLTPLASLVWLEYLDLSRNHITEVTALAVLVQLKVLVLEQNAGPDLSPLQGLSQLARLELTEGMVESAAAAGLQARGVEVAWQTTSAGEVPAIPATEVVMTPAVAAGPTGGYSEQDERPVATVGPDAAVHIIILTKPGGGSVAALRAGLAAAAFRDVQPGPGAFAAAEPALAQVPGAAGQSAQPEAIEIDIPALEQWGVLVNNQGADEASGG